MPKINRLCRFAIGGIFSVAALMCIAIYYQPNDLESLSPSAGIETKASLHAPEHERSVTCYEDCQVTFGIGQSHGSDTNRNQFGRTESEVKSGSTKHEALNALAQRRMAYWTVWLAGFTAAGLVLLVGTLWEAVEATRAANDAAKASLLTNDTTREIGVVQARAYLSVVGGEFSLDESLPFQIEFMISILNSGNSPATEIDIDAEICFEGWGEAADGIFRKPADQLRIDEIGSKVRYPRETLLNCNIGDLDHLIDMSLGHFVGIHGTLKYRHVFLKSDDPPDEIHFALAGRVDRKSTREKGTISSLLNTCRSARWERQSK